LAAAFDGVSRTDRRSTLFASGLPDLREKPFQQHDFLTSGAPVHPPLFEMTGVSACIPLFAAGTLTLKDGALFHGVAAGDGNGVFELVLPDDPPDRLRSGRLPTDAKLPQNDSM
jgi:hypothetical protein